MKKVIFIIFIWAAASLLNGLQAQIFTVLPGTNATIKSGTIFSAENLILNPTADFTLSNVSLKKSTTVSHDMANPYIARVYQFSNTTNQFTGRIQINYKDGAELKGIAESQLVLDIFVGYRWKLYPSTTPPTFRDANKNYVLTSGISCERLDELTLAANFLSPQLRPEYSLANTDQLFDCKVSPNPSSRSFNLQIESSSAEKIEVNLLDLSGKLLSRLIPVKNQIFSFGDDLQRGVYMVEIIQGDQRKTVTVIKQ